MSERFYINWPLTPGPITIDGPEGHHLASVCRFRPGDEVCLFNGDGHEYPARITQVARRAIELEIVGVAKPERELAFTLEVAAPIPKGDRGQFLVEKLTELGVTKYVPLNCARSNPHPRECKRDKLERYVIEASKQCGRNVLMQIDNLTDWGVYGVGGSSADLRILAHPYDTVDGATWTAEPMRQKTIRIAVGPEGGFTDAEISSALASGWRSVSLGPRILRVETAAIVLAARVIGT